MAMNIAGMRVWMYAEGFMLCCVQAEGYDFNSTGVTSSFQPVHQLQLWHSSFFNPNTICVHDGNSSTQNARWIYLYAGRVWLFSKVFQPR